MVFFPLHIRLQVAITTQQTCYDWMVAEHHSHKNSHHWWAQSYNVSPLYWRQWQVGLLNHSERAFANFVTMGVREGFHISYDTMLQNRRGTAKNMPSSIEKREVVRAVADLGGVRGVQLNPLLAGSFTFSQIYAGQQTVQNNYTKWVVLYKLAYQQDLGLGFRVLRHYVFHHIVRTGK